MGQIPAILCFSSREVKYVDTCAGTFIGDNNAHADEDAFLGIYVSYRYALVLAGAFLTGGRRCCGSYLSPASSPSLP